MAPPSYSMRGAGQFSSGCVSADSSEGEGSKQGVLAEGHPGPPGEDTASLSLPQLQKGGNVRSPSQEKTSGGWGRSLASLCTFSLTSTQSGRRGLGEGTEHAPRCTLHARSGRGRRGEVSHREDVTTSRPENWTWASSSRLLSLEHTLSPPFPQ